MRNLWAITAYFNPVGYRRRLQNYLAFRRLLNVPLVTVELAFGRDFELPPGSADILVQLQGHDVLWQKERLLNLALARLPAQCDCVAWLDCDVVFDRDDWAERCAAALAHVPMLQPFRRVYEPSADGWDGTSRVPADASLGHSLADLFERGVVAPDCLRSEMRIAYRCNSGLAWAARREILDGDGFYDACVMGSGNRAMLCAALGTNGDAIEYLQMTPAWQRHYTTWARRHFAAVGARLGSIDGTVIHQWHGDLARRRYGGRHRDFRAHGFDPVTDIALDANGCWRWNSRKPGMHEFVASYFRLRAEDG